MRLAFTRFPTEIFFHLSLLLRSFSCLNERKHFSKAWWVNEINYTWRLSAKVKPCSLDAWSDRTRLCATCAPQISPPALPRRRSSSHFWRVDLSAMPRWWSLILSWVEVCPWFVQHLATSLLTLAWLVLYSQISAKTRMEPFTIGERQLLSQSSENPVKDPWPHHLPYCLLQYPKV